MLGVIFLGLSGIMLFTVLNKFENSEPVSIVEGKESEELPPYITKNENSEYQVLQMTDCCEEPGAEKIIGKLNKGDVVLILKLADFSDHSQVWGETEDGWCLIQNEKTNYLEKIQLKDSKAYEINKFYKALDNQPVYSKPSLLSKSNSDVRMNDVVEIEEIKEDQFGTVWGKSTSGAWMMMRNGEIEHFEKTEDDQTNIALNQETNTQKQIDSKNNYILPESNSKYITTEELASLSLQEINYAKNEIYARHGRKFNSNELQNYFDQQSWYRGSISPNDFSDQVFNEFEKANIKALEEEEYNRSPNGYLLDR